LEEYPRWLRLIEIEGQKLGSAAMNRFLNILESARDNKWCMNLYCTSCGSTEFRSAMKQLGDGLADELASLYLSALKEMLNFHKLNRGIFWRFFTFCLILLSHIIHPVVWHTQSQWQPAFAGGVSPSGVILLPQ
jgi:hypothetical protein